MTGLGGRLVATWDRLPIKGLVAALVVVGGGAAAIFNGVLGDSTCDSDPFKGVYHHERLKLVEDGKCATVTGTVIAWRHEHDGDWHVNMRMDDPGWTNAANDRGQHGFTVVEFVPLMGRPDRFASGQRLKLMGTKVYDQQHKLTTEANGWIELHPVFEVEDVTPPAVQLGKNRWRLAPATEKEGSMRDAP